VRGVPVLVHWTLPLAPILCGGWQGWGGAVGIVLVIFVHELGHVALVRLRGLYALSLQMHGLGGEVVYGGNVTPLDRSIVAWGGFLAQALLLAAAALCLRLVQAAHSLFVSQLFVSLTLVNGLIAIFNMLPQERLDGWHAWRVFGRYLAARPKRGIEKRRR
jgi:Zn-dependent protease